MAGRLTTHVLNTREGQPAAGVMLELWAIAPSGERALIKQTQTNADGRTDAPLLADDELSVGVYELVFMIGAYFREAGVVNADPMFLDHVPVRFGISDVAAHYHVPLLASPWAYSTYRGS
jgi:5-hydroxyisourate hydrolase